MIAHSLVIARLEVDALPPALRALSIAILALQTSVQHVSLLTLTTAIEGFSVTLANAPSLAPLQAALNKVGHLGAAIDCLGQLVASAQRFNASVFSLPAALDSITGAYAVANASFAPVAAQVIAFNATMRSIEDAIAAAPNFTTILEVSHGWLLQRGTWLFKAILTRLSSAQQVNVAAGFINNPPVNVSTVIAAINDTASAISLIDVNVSTLLANLAQVNASLWDPGIVVPLMVSESLVALAPLVSNLTAMVNASIIALDIFNDTVRCQGTTTPCAILDSTAFPCLPANPCTAAEPTCMIDGATRCFFDSACPTGVCPFRGPTFAVTRDTLYVYGSLPKGADMLQSSLSSLTGPLKQVTTSLEALPNVTSFAAQLTELRATLSTLPVAQTQSELAQLRATLNPSTLGIESAQNAIAEMQIAVTDNLGVVRSNVLSLNATFETIVREALSVGSRVRRLCNVADTYFNTTLQQSTDQLTSDNMAAALASRGLEGAFDVFVGVINAAAGAINAVTNDTLVEIDTAAVATALTRISGPLYNASISAAGPLYFFAMLAGMTDLVGPSEAAAGGGIFVAPSGVPWSGGRVCLAASCVTSTVLAVNRAAPLSLAAITGNPGGLGLSIPVSREMLTFLPLLAPIAALALASVAALGFWGKRWQWYPACCSAICICLTVTATFSLVSGIALPMVMAFADGCRGGVNVGAHYVRGSEHALCDSLGGIVRTSYGGPGQCTLLLPEGQSLVLPIADLFEAVVGSCALQPAVVSSVWINVARVLAATPPLVVNGLTGAGNTSGAIPFSALGGAAPRPQIVKVLEAAGLAAGITAAKFAESLGEQLSCETINGALAAVANSLCCDILSALYWLVSAWSVMAFAMCFCGFGASVLGCKRLPNDLWGADYEARCVARAVSKPPVAIEMVQVWSSRREGPTHAPTPTGHAPACDPASVLPDRTPVPASARNVQGAATTLAVASEFEPLTAASTSSGGSHGDASSIAEPGRLTRMSPGGPRSQTLRSSRGGRRRDSVDSAGSVNPLLPHASPVPPASASALSGERVVRGIAELSRSTRTSGSRPQPNRSGGSSRRDSIDSVGSVNPLLPDASPVPHG